MPWDATRLRVAAVQPDGSLGPARTLAGGPGDLDRPAGLARRRRPALRLGRVRRGGTCTRSTARAGSTRRPATWRRWRWSSATPPGSSGGRRTPSRTMAGSSRSAAPTVGTRSCGSRPQGRSHRSRTRRRRSPRSRASRWRSGSAILIGAGPHDGAVVARLDPRSGRVTGILARSLSTPIDPGILPHAEPIEFPTSGGAMARALYFPPTNDGFVAPAGELPPLLVLSHGGPTSAASSALSLERAFFTSRGIAVVDVDYRGSTGYGRPYRDALNGQVGDRRRRRLRGRGPVPRGPRLGGPAADGDQGRQRRRLHDPGRAHDPARGLRRRHQPLRDRGPRDHPPRRPQVRVALRRGPARPVAARAAPCSASARRSTRSTASSPRC